MECHGLACTICLKFCMPAVRYSGFCDRKLFSICHIFVPFIYKCVIFGTFFNYFPLLTVPAKLPHHAIFISLRTGKAVLFFPSANRGILSSNL
uniref:Uncharacterized protein n=1 Tax=Arundo donax TaxID=35708 RepID=A0A0A8Y4X0_ARUDO